MTLTQNAKHLLVHTKVDPLVVANLWGVTETECWDYINDYERFLDTAVASYNRHSMQKELQEWISTIPNLKALKLANLREKLQDAKLHPEKYNVKTLLLEKDILLGKVTGVTIDQIEKAKQYPITTLLDVTKKGNISCPFHPDRTPSFHIKKNNTFTCFSCHEYGDVIHLYQKLHKKSFIEAVRILST